MSQCPPCFPLCSGTPGDGRAAPPRVTTQSGSSAGSGGGTARCSRHARQGEHPPRLPDPAHVAARPRVMVSVASVVWTRVTGRAAGTKMAAQYPAQPSPAQPSGDVSISGQPVPPCWPRRRVHRHCSHINTALVFPPSLCGPEPPQRWSRLFCSAVRGPSQRSLSSSCSDPRRPSWLGRSSSSCCEVATWRGWVQCSWCEVTGVAA